MSAWLKKHTALNVVRLLCAAVIAVLFVRSLIDGNGRHVLYTCVTFAFMFLPELVILVFKLDVPDPLSIVYVLMLFSANILGELFEVYLSLPLWDSLLHLVSGFFIALLGCSLFELMTGEKPKPLAAALFAFMFAVLFGVLWEYFEYFMDSVFHTDMQKDKFLSSVSSVLLNPDGTNYSVTREVGTVVVDGETWPGYIDIGLHDTMNDMLIASLGALVASLFCYFNEKDGRLFRFIRVFFIKGKKRGRK